MNILWIYYVNESNYLRPEATNRKNNWRFKFEEEIQDYISGCGAYRIRYLLNLNVSISIHFTMG